MAKAQPAGSGKGNGGSTPTTVTLAGSIYDYTWSQGRKGSWAVTDMDRSDGDTGTASYANGTILVFDDARITLGQDSPTTVQAPTVVYTRFNEPVSYDVKVTDYDNRIDVSTVSNPAIGQLVSTSRKGLRGGKANQARCGLPSIRARPPDCQILGWFNWLKARRSRSSKKSW